MFKKFLLIFVVLIFFNSMDAYVIDSVKIVLEPLNDSSVRVFETIVYDFDTCFENAFRVIPIKDGVNVSEFNFSSTDSGEGIGFFYEDFFELDYFFGPIVCNKLVTMHYSYLLSNVSRKFLDGVLLSMEVWGGNWSSVREFELVLKSNNFLIKESYVVPSKVFKQDNQINDLDAFTFLYDIPKGQSIFFNAWLENDSFFAHNLFSKRVNKLGFNEFKSDREYYSNTSSLIFLFSKISFFIILIPLLIFSFFYFPLRKKGLSTFQTKPPSDISVGQLAKITLSSKDLKKRKDLIFKAMLLQLVFGKRLKFFKNRLKVVDQKNVKGLDFFVLGFFDKFNLQKRLTKEFRIYLKSFSKGFESDLVLGKKLFLGHWLRYHNYFQALFILVYGIFYVSIINSKIFSPVFNGFYFSIVGVFVSVLLILVVLVKPHIFNEKNLSEVKMEWNGFKTFLQSEELIYTYKPTNLSDWEELLVFSYFFEVEKTIIKIMKHEKIESDLISLINSEDFKEFSLS